MLKVVFQVSAMELNSRLDLTEIFCDVDDFYRSFEQYCRSIKPSLTLRKVHHIALNVKDMDELFFEILKCEN